MLVLFVSDLLPISSRSCQPVTSLPPVSPSSCLIAFRFSDLSHSSLGFLVYVLERALLPNLCLYRFLELTFLSFWGIHLAVHYCLTFDGLLALARSSSLDLHLFWVFISDAGVCLSHPLGSIFCCSASLS